MPTPGELREISRLARRDAAEETCPHLKQRLTRYAFTLAEFAEKIEHGGAVNLSRTE
jgi:hypothetical protein